MPWQGPAGGGPTANGWSAARRALQGAPRASRWTAIGPKTHVMMVARDGEVRRSAPPTASLKPPAARCSAAGLRHLTAPSIAVRLFSSGVERRWRTRSFSWLARTLSALCRSISVIPTILASHAGADASGSENAGARSSWPQVSCRPLLCMAAAWGSPHQVTRCTADRNLQSLCGNLGL